MTGEQFLDSGGGWVIWVELPMEEEGEQGVCILKRCLIPGWQVLQRDMLSWGIYRWRMKIPTVAHGNS
eukprot:13376761-Ditylum_brightwellii.AAC.1